MAVIALGVVAGAVFIVGSAVRGVSRQVGVTGGPIGPPGVFPTVTAVTPVDAGGRIIVEQAAHRSAVILSEHPNAAERRATAQTFRAPGSGLVLGEAAVFALGRPDRVTVSLYEVHGDGPTDGTKLRARTVSIHGPLGPGYLVVRFDEPVEVRPGRVYALVVAPAGPGELLVGRVPNDDLYEGGRPWELGPGGWRAVAGELTFRLTFWLAGPVAVPLPSPTS